MPIESLSPIRIASLHRDYEVSFSSNFDDLLRELSDLAAHFIIVDETIFHTHNSALRTVFQSENFYVVKATEDTKTLGGVRSLIDWLLSRGAVRSSTIVAIGGGIVQDLVAFTSCIYYRGVNYKLVPTTLLSMCDSSIGAKCGINHGEFKNQLGVVYAPSAVYICTAFLSTLSDLDIKSGYGELLKLAITDSSNQFHQLRDSVEVNGLRSEHVTQLIRASLLTKKKVIEVDEYEKDLRRILNYGHTFGHALESLSGYAIPHGLGVAWGIDVVNYLAVRLGLLERTTRAEIRDFIATNLKFKLAQFPDADELIRATKRDKKVADGLLNLILMSDYGHLAITPVAFDGQLRDLVADYLVHENVFS